MIRFPIKLFLVFIFFIFSLIIYKRNINFIWKICLFLIIPSLSYTIYSFWVVYNRHTKNDKRTNNHVGWSLTILGIVITIIFTGIIANQLVQPLFEPRVSDIKYNLASFNCVVNPEDEEVKCYGIFELQYEIEFPLILYNNIIDLHLPRPKEPGNLQIMCDYKKIKPYFNEIDFCEDNSFVNFDKINYTIKLNLMTTALRVRSDTYSLIIRDEVDLSPGNPAFNEPVWYSQNSISPLEVPKKIFTKGPILEVGYLEIKPSNSYYIIYKLSIKSLVDSWINGLPINSQTGGKDYDFVCDEDIKLGIVQEKDIHVFITQLGPREEKYFLALSRISQEEFNQTIEERYAQVFPMRGRTDCYDFWNYFKGLELNRHSK